MRGLIGRGLLLAWFALFVSGCAVHDRQGTADKLAAQGGFIRSQIKSDPFVLTAFARRNGRGTPLTVYIEGDGLAWLDTNRVSADPTPITPMALLLAVGDSAPNVAYLARPCQFTDRHLNPRCSEAYWTDRRFAEEVVVSMNGAIDALVRESQAPSVNLVGYSGGGAIAALVAARRGDVTSLRTVAGNLDHKAVNAYHKVDQQKGSLNAIDVAPTLNRLPQRHFSGTEDKTIPPFVGRSFAQATGNSPCVKVTEVSGVSHASGWSDLWPQLLRQSVDCQ